MPLTFRLVLLTLTLSSVLWGQTPTPSTAQHSLTARWYGHGFIYLISSSGMRIAIDPFLPNSEEYRITDSVDYAFPPQLPADVALVSNPAEASSGVTKLAGDPPCFRGTVAIGKNKAHGLIFTGVESYIDQNRTGENTCFVFTLDGVRFAHLGAVGQVLNSDQIHELGSVDVVFLPVGNPALPVADMRKMAADLGARIIVPISYATPYNTKLTLRKLDDFLQGATNIQQIDSNEFSLNLKTLPSSPTIFVLKNPPQS